MAGFVFFQPVQLRRSARKLANPTTMVGMPIAILSADAAECLLATIHITPIIIIPREIRYASIVSLMAVVISLNADWPFPKN